MFAFIGTFRHNIFSFQYEQNIPTWHTDAVEPSNLIQTGGIIMARIRHAFVDVHLATRTLISLKTFTLERAFGVEAAAAMFTRVGT